MRTAAPVHQTKIHLSDLAQAIADELQLSLGCDSRSELIEWLILCQRFSAPEARVLLANRRKRGERGIVVVVPDDYELPPEG